MKEENAALCRALSESGGLMAYTPEAASALIDPGYGHEDYCVISADALGIMVNSDVLTRMGISAPRTWDDLLEPVYRELVWLPAYDTAEGRLFVRAMMEYFGDDAADYLTQLDTSVQFYTTGTDTARLTAFSSSTSKPPFTPSVSMELTTTSPAPASTPRRTHSRASSPVSTRPPFRNTW